MKDLRRVQYEIGLLEKCYGPDMVYWDQNYKWVYVDNYILPAHKFNVKECKILVLVPDHYGNGANYRDFFMPQGIRTLKDGSWTALPHYFEQYPYKTLNDSFVGELQGQGWCYQCLHASGWKPNHNILLYLDQVYTFLCEPFRNWEDMKWC